MFSCDTLHCFKPIIQAKGAPNPIDGGVYYTSAINQPLDTTANWLYNLFTYKARGTGITPWKPSLDYALSKTNAAIANTPQTNPALKNGWSVVT